jgi:glycosyltransferase involved in cell wall biosynthesis
LIFDPSASRRPLRIAVVGARGLPSNYSGVECVVEELYPRLAARGHTITLYAHQVGGRQKSNYKGVQVIPIWTSSWPTLGAISYTAGSAAAICKSRNFDVVHLHAVASGLAIHMLRAAGIPTVWTVHGADWKRRRWSGAGSAVLKHARGFAIRHSQEIIVASRDLQLYFLSSHHRCTHLVYHTVDVPVREMTSDISVLSTWGLMPGCYISIVARLVPEKRIHDLIKAFRALVCPISLVVVGDGASDYERWLRELSSGDPRIFFIGKQSRDHVRTIVNNSIAAALISELEGFPVAALESILQGVPTILSDIPPHREMIKMEGYPLFVRVGDIHDLTKCIQYVWQNAAQLRDQMRTVASAVAARFDVNTMVDRVEAILTSACRRGTLA